MITKFDNYIFESKSMKQRLKEQRIVKGVEHDNLVKWLNIDYNKFIEYLKSIIKDNSTRDFIDIINYETDYNLFDNVFNYVLKLLIKNKSDSYFICNDLFLRNYEYFLQKTEKSSENFQLLIDFIKLNYKNNIFYFNLIIDLVYKDIEFFNIIEDNITKLVDIKRFEDNKDSYGSITKSYYNDLERLLKFYSINNKDKYVYEILDLLNNDNLHINRFIQFYNKLSDNKNYIDYYLNILKNKYEINSEKLETIILSILNFSYQNDNTDEIKYNKVKYLINYFSDIKLNIHKNKLINAVKNIEDEYKTKLLELFNENKITFLQYLKLNHDIIFQELNYKKSSEHLIILFDSLSKIKPNKIWNNVKYLFIDFNNEIYYSIYEWLNEYDIVKYIPTEIIILLNYTHKNYIDIVKNLIEKYFDVIDKDKILRFFRQNFINTSHFEFRRCFQLDLTFKRNGRTYNSDKTYVNYKGLIDWYCIKLIEFDENYYSKIKDVISSTTLLKNHQHLVNANNFDLI